MRALARVAVLAGTGSVVVALSIGAALAYWHSTGTSNGSATTGTLAAPASVVASSSAGTGTVAVSWSAPAGASGYYVRRIAQSGTASAACGTSAAAPIATTSCSDTGVPVGTYTYDVTALLNTWTARSASSAAVTVAQAAQSITFTSSPSAPTYLGSYAVTATGGASGNPVVFGTGTPGVCTVSGGTVSFVHAGACTITADQAGSAYYAAAPQGQQSFTVAQRGQTVAFTSTAPAGATVGGANYTVTTSGGGSGNAVLVTVDAVATGVCTVNGASVSFQHAGTCVLDANQAGTADYAAANQVQQSIAVGKGSQATNFTSTAPNPGLVGDTYSVSATTCV